MKRITKFLHNRIKQSESLNSLFVMFFEFHHQDIHSRIDDLDRKIDEMLEQLKNKN